MDRSRMELLNSPEFHFYFTCFLRGKTMSKGYIYIINFWLFVRRKRVVQPYCWTRRPAGRPLEPANSIIQTFLTCSPVPKFSTLGLQYVHSNMQACNYFSKLCNLFMYWMLHEIYYLNKNGYDEINFVCLFVSIIFLMSYSKEKVMSRHLIFDFQAEFKTLLCVWWRYTKPQYDLGNKINSHSRIEIKPARYCHTVLRQPLHFFSFTLCP